MTTFICKRCNYETNIKCNLIRHLKKAKECEPLFEYNRKDLLNDLNNKNGKEDIACEYCNKLFNFASNKSRHKKNCESNPKNKNSLVEQVLNLTKIVEDLQNKSKTQETTCINNNNTTNNTQNINITVPKIKNFGWENMDAIPESLVSSLFMNLRFKELLANLHCDPNFPENQNVRIKSVKRNTMEIYRNNKWDIVTFTKGLTDLLLQGHKIFTDYYNKDKKRILEEDMDEQDLREILSQLQKIQDLNKSEIKPLIDELQMMLEEYRENGHAIVLA